MSPESLSFGFSSVSRPPPGTTHPENFLFKASPQSAAKPDLFVFDLAGAGWVGGSSVKGKPVPYRSTRRETFGGVCGSTRAASHFVCLTRKKMETGRSPNSPRQSSASVSRSKNAHGRGQRNTHPRRLQARHAADALGRAEPRGSAPPEHRKRPGARPPRRTRVYPDGTLLPFPLSSSPTPRPVPPGVTCFRAAAPAPPHRPLTWFPARRCPADGKRCPYMGADSGGAGRQLSASPAPRSSSKQLP